MGRSSPNEKYPLLYINNHTKKLTQIQKLSPDKFRVKGAGGGKAYITRTYLQNHYSYYGIIDRFGVVIRYRKEGRVWIRDFTAAAFDPKSKKWKTALESEEAMIKELNKMNKGNPELAFYDSRKSSEVYLGSCLARKELELHTTPKPKAKENWDEV